MASARDLLLFLLGDVPLEEWQRDAAALWERRIKASTKLRSKRSFSEQVLLHYATEKPFSMDGSFTERRIRQLDVTADRTRPMYYFNLACYKAGNGARVPWSALRTWLKDEECGSDDDDEEEEEEAKASGAKRARKEDPHLHMLRVCFGLGEEDVAAWAENENVFVDRILDHMRGSYSNCGELWQKVRNEGAEYYLDSYTDVPGVPKDVFFYTMVCRDGPKACICHEEDCWRSKMGWKEHQRAMLAELG